MTARGSHVPFWPGMPTARAIAADAGAHGVGTQHVLLALLRRRAADAVAVLDAGGVDEGAVAAALGAVAGTGCRTGAVPTERVTVSPRVLALVRAAGRPDGGTGPVSDLQLLRALLADNEPSLARLLLSSLGALRRIDRALQDATVRVDDTSGGLVDA
ncbi:hypothetical protein [Actinomycetospora soli]|uniref:hypothetical protein n=1 Tax=Actinomycetospora soli TaxID=2893887 RepID=UPI001E2ABE0F|nr:hypothetical protein [Actinomycetospora soli]MCD2188013.1 hypothetical protein [Actinomycetospora soli]